MATFSPFSMVCGSLKDTNDDDASYSSNSLAAAKMRKKPIVEAGLLSKTAQMMCAASPTNSLEDTGSHEEEDRSKFFGDDAESDDERDQQEGKKANSMSALFARALISEVTDNPKTMTPAEMAEREKKLMKAQEKARKDSSSKAVGGQGGFANAKGVLGAMQNFSLSGHHADSDSKANTASGTRTVQPPDPMSENRAQVQPGTGQEFQGKHSITIGLSLSRRHSTLGHPDTVTRQTAFDFNELQDRQYKYVSSTDSSGWRAGGGERGGGQGQDGNKEAAPGLSPSASINNSGSEDADGLVSFLQHHDKEFHDGSSPTGNAPAPLNNGLPGGGAYSQNYTNEGQELPHKVAAPDTVHIPIIQIDCTSPAAVDQIISALARGEIFIPHMSVLPEALSVNGVSPPDLVVRFGCERNDDVPPDEWPNWCLEFMHNQLYDYFHNMGARWMKRPFQITLAKKVRWKTVKHMNKYFAHSERVVNAWREKGPQHLDPQLSYIEGGATPEEVARPHGIYLLRNGRPTNYFAPNFEPPYTTKMTRSLLLNVIGKSWDKKRRDWTSEPLPRLVTPAVLMATMCGCSDASQGGFIASEVTTQAPLKNSGAMENMTAGYVQDQQPGTKKKKKKKQQEAVLHEQPQASQHVHTKNTVSPSQDAPKSKKDFIIPLQGSQSADSAESSGSFADSVPSHGSNYSYEEGHSPDGDNSVGASPSATDRSPETRNDAPENAMSPVSQVSNGGTLQLSPAGSDERSFNGNEKQGGNGSVSSSRIELEAERKRRTQEQDENKRKMEALERALAEQTRLREGEAAERQREQEMLLRVAKQQEDAMKDRLEKERTEKDQEEEDDDKEKSAKLRKKEKKEKKKKKEKEKERQIAMIALAAEEAEKARANVLNLTKQQSASPIRTRSSQQGTIEKSNSQVSLEYSVDESMFGDSSLFGGQFTTDGSVMTMGTAATGNQSLLSYVTRSTAGGDYGGNQENKSQNTMNGNKLSKDPKQVKKDEEAHSQSSVSEVVPSDEDLFAVGWAKALDPGSGSYYFFTLDRTKTVWDNPLLQEVEPASPPDTHKYSRTIVR